MTYIESETPAQTQNVIHVQIDQRVFELPIHESSVIKISVGPAGANGNAQCKLPPKFQELAKQYSDEVEALVAKGFTNQRLVLRLLNKCGGNVEQVEQILVRKRQGTKKQSRTCKHDGKGPFAKEPKCKFQELHERYSNEVEVLVTKGFENTRLALRLLHKYNGDVNHVESLLAKRMKGQMKRSILEDSKKENLAQQYAVEIESLVAKGFENRYLIARLLNRFDGNVELTERILLKKQKCKIPGGFAQLSPKCKFQELCERYSHEVELLSSKGFFDTRLVVRLLHKFDGNAEQVEQILERKQRKSGSESQVQELSQRYSSEIEALAAKGFENTVLIVRLLKKFDGNVDKVEQILVRKRQGMKNRDIYSEALTQMAQRGYLNPRKNFIALRKSDGDVEKACAWLASKSC